LDIHHDLLALGRVLAVAIAVGLDVLAVSIGVGVASMTELVLFGRRASTPAAGAT